MALDAIGQSHPRAQGEVRVVSLVPSLTELLFDLGLGAQVVGRTGFCVHPRQALRAVPKVGGTKDVDLDKVRALAPTHLVVNVDENEKPAVDEMRAFVPHVIVTHPIDVEDNFGLYGLLGAVFDREAAARRLRDRLQAELDAIRDAAFAPVPVLYLIWKDPWMTVGPQTYIARMLAQAGLRTAAPETGERYPQLDFDRFGGERFDAVLLPSEPFRFTDEHLRALRADPRLRARPALRIDGEMVSWYGSRAILGLRYLREFRQAFDRATTGAPREAGAQARASRGRPEGVA